MLRRSSEVPVYVIGFCRTCVVWSRFLNDRAQERPGLFSLSFNATIFHFLKSIREIYEMKNYTLWIKMAQFVFLSNSVAS